MIIKHKYNRVGANTMKIYDIVSENNVNEAPGGSALGDLARKVGAKAAGAVGMKATAAGLQGKVDSSARAKEINVKWKQFAGQTGVGKSPDVGDLADFFAKEKLPTGRLKGLSGMMTPQQVDDILTKTAQDTFRSPAGQAKVGDTPAAQVDAPADGGGASAPADNEPKTGQFRKDEPAQGQQPAQGGATAPAGSTAPAAGGAIPKNIADQLAKLNPEQKKELFQLL
tara:strand:+ start:1715 stop:2392 length:678 start_codon:yes stop_codon:yes gene_type:complete